MQDRFVIAAALREIGQLLAVKGENRFKVRAYERAARALEALNMDLEKVIKERRLTDISGIGPALAGVIEEIYRTGESSGLERLRAELPPGASELSAVPGLSLPKLIALHDALGIKTVSELKSACEKGLVRGVKGFGERSESKILKAIEQMEKRVEGMLLPEALAESERLLSYLRSHPDVLNADVAGALRRWRETIHNIKLVVASRHHEAVLEHFSRFPAGVEVATGDQNPCKVRLANGIYAEVMIASPDDYPTAVHYFTGSKKHRARLEDVAHGKGMTLGAQGLHHNGGKKFAIKEEEGIYRYLGMQFVPPELREDEGEIEAALAGALPDLVAAADIQGLTHCHTVYSDGRNTVEEMARAAEALGMKYLTITDHSPSASYAGGVKIDRLRAQWDEIEKTQEKVKIKLLRGTESDILDDGGLDYPDFILEKLDIIIASIHVRSGMDARRMTQRLIGAMKSPFFKIWGHPLGRLLQSRPPLECELEKVLDVIAESKAAIEVNGDPRRLDLEPRWIRAARRRGIRFLVSTDAHSTESLKYVRYGVAMARRGWLTRDEILNTMDTESFMKAVHP
jgi:DNA polymerase (family 10)